MTQLERYMVVERSKKAIEQHGSADKAIKYLQAELNSFEDMWSGYSGDSLGHGITCNRLMISYIKETYVV